MVLRLCSLTLCVLLKELKAFPYSPSPKFSYILVALGLIQLVYKDDAFWYKELISLLLMGH